jgi:hypothetical protein
MNTPSGSILLSVTVITSPSVTEPAGLESSEGPVCRSTVDTRFNSHEQPQCYLLLI